MYSRSKASLAKAHVTSSGVRAVGIEVSSIAEKTQHSNRKLALRQSVASKLAAGRRVVCGSFNSGVCLRAAGAGRGARGARRVKVYTAASLHKRSAGGSRVTPRNIKGEALRPRRPVAAGPGKFNVLQSLTRSQLCKVETRGVPSTPGLRPLMSLDGVYPEALSGLRVQRREENAKGGSRSIRRETCGCRNAHFSS
ncbi:hypothetical protein EVAR_49892_1 [Eumeta japonica]|uniref:Uncharacterized protein n=1 Tax=Eumeta variegata TaxID=151549 RepID=A0A4C1Y296_EUMVA|nr:hypothetical protein EVAR_49892_1 [Eumeta japonica]